MDVNAIFPADKKRPWPAELLRRYFAHDVNRESAALTYYLIFSIFPLSIFISTLLGALDLNIDGITNALSRFIPADVVNFVEMYLNYVTENPSTALLVFGLIFSIYFPMRAVDTLMRSVRRAYHIKRPQQPVRYFAKKLIYTIFLILTIILSLVLVVFSRNVLRFWERFFPIPAIAVSLWSRFRFAALGLLMFFVLAVLYGFAQDTRQPLRNILPGVLASLCAWLAASFAFSFYVTNFSNYSVLYGSIGAMIVLLLWLYMSSTIMTMGAEFNSVLIDRREAKKNETKQK